MRGTILIEEQLREIQRLMKAAPGPPPRPGLEWRGGDEPLDSPPTWGVRSRSVFGSEYRSGGAGSQSD